MVVFANLREGSMNHGGALLLEISGKFNRIRTNPKTGEVMALDALLARILKMQKDDPLRAVLLDHHMATIQSLLGREKQLAA